MELDSKLMIKQNWFREQPLEIITLYNDAPCDGTSLYQRYSKVNNMLLFKAVLKMDRYHQHSKALPA